MAVVRQGEDCIETIGAELVVKAYENHKTHARFQESQRSWVMGAFIAFSSGLLTVVASDNLIKLGAETTVFMLGLHLAFCVLTGIAITKLSRERGRHFRQAETILAECRALVAPTNARLGTLVAVSQLETSSYSSTGLRQLTIKFLSVAAVYNYFVALFFAIDIGLILDHLAAPRWAVSIVPIAVFLLACYAQHRLSRWFAGKPSSPVASTP